MQSFKELFKQMKPAVIGMIHVKALPGAPKSKLTIHEISRQACKEMEIYRQAGVDGVMIENMHDIPYIQSDQIGPDTVANMTRICTDIASITNDIPRGVQILAACNNASLAVAAAAGFQFIRVEGFVFSHIADEGPIHACAGSLLRYRKLIGAENVKIFADIKKKHSSHSITNDVDLCSTAQAAQFFLTDGVILTGPSTGSPADIEELEAVRSAVNVPVLIGSGVNINNVHKYIHADGLIIGSHFKENDRWDQELNLEKICKFMERIRDVRCKL